MKLVCYDCAESGRGQRCECGEPLWIEPGRDEKLRPSYSEIIPVDSSSGMARSTGNTPMFRAPQLDISGVEVHIKDESRNPTLSFKDRGSALGASKLSSGDTIGTVSHGNMAMSVAAYAASYSLNCVVLVPDDIPDERVSAIARYGPKIIKVEGDYGNLYRRSLNIEEVEFVNSDSPLRVEGQKTLGYEILADFSPEVPDGVVLPVSSGGNASAVWKSMLETGVKWPIYLVQTEVCNPIERAYRDKNSEVKSLNENCVGDAVAYSIANPDPPSGTRALAAVRDTGGSVVSVSDEEIIDAKNEFAVNSGMCVETASATTLAGMRELVDRGEIERGDEVVLVVTGSGFKEGMSVNSEDEVNAESITIHELEERLWD